MKPTLLLVTTLLLMICHALAAQTPLAEIVELIVSNQKNALGFEDGDRFEVLMWQVGAEAAKLSQADIQKLNPALLEDRIRMIALYRFQHRNLFDGIYHVYVRHPSEAEIEKRKQEYLILHPPGTAPAEDANDQNPLAGVGHQLPAPAEIEALHLTASYRFCFEYYLLAPKHETTLKHYDVTLGKALDRLKKQVKDVDIRVLVEARLYAELETHLQGLKLLGCTMDELKDHLGLPAFEVGDSFGYFFHAGGNAHAYYLGQLQDGKVSSFKRIEEADWRKKFDEAGATSSFFRPSRK